MQQAHEITKLFEQEIAKYCGSPYAVAVTSCTIALQLCCEYLHVKEVCIPKRTYLSLPQCIIKAGGKVKYRDEDWVGMYRLEPYNIWDCARLTTSNMYMEGTFMCLSLHWAKTLSVGQGGVILTDDKDAYEWFKRMRFDGRTEGMDPKDEKTILIGHHAYMSPRDSAEALTRLALLPRNNPPLPNSDYPDLSLINFVSHKESSKDPLDQIEEIRKKNNVLWMDILRLARDRAPRELQLLVSQIKNNDREITGRL